jgi:hypothetical protein
MDVKIQPIIKTIKGITEHNVIKLIKEKYKDSKLSATQSKGTIGLPCKRKDIVIYNKPNTEIVIYNKPSYLNVPPIIYIEKKLRTVAAPRLAPTLLRAATQQMQESQSRIKNDVSDQVYKDKFNFILIKGYPSLYDKNLLNYSLFRDTARVNSLPILMNQNNFIYSSYLFETIFTYYENIFFAQRKHEVFYKGLNFTFNREAFICYYLKDNKVY